MNRRQFISSFSLLLSYPLLSQLVFASSSIADKPLFSAKDWKTLLALQQHLFPEGQNTPSAAQFNAHQWLYQFLLKQGKSSSIYQDYQYQLKKVDLLAKKKFKQSFAALGVDDKEQLLRLVEQDRQGQRWLAHLLNKILEALLSDPFYGANTNTIGWKWLEHQAGFPRPDKLISYTL